MAHATGNTCQKRGHVHALTCVHHPRTCGGHTNSGSFLRVSDVGMVWAVWASCLNFCFTPSGIFAGLRVSVLIVTHVLHTTTFTAHAPTPEAKATADRGSHAQPAEQSVLLQLARAAPALLTSISTCWPQKLTLLLISYSGISCRQPGSKLQGSHKGDLVLCAYVLHEQLYVCTGARWLTNTPGTAMPLKSNRHSRHSHVCMVTEEHLNH